MAGSEEEVVVENNEVQAEETQVEEQVTETAEEKAVRLEKENAELQERYKKAHSESSDLGRKLKYYQENTEEKLNTIMESLKYRQTETTSAKETESIDPYDIEQLRRIAREEAAAEEQRRMDTINKKQEQYGKEFASELKNLQGDLDDDEYASIVEYMEGMDATTGNGVADARINFATARANMLEESTGKKRTIKLKGDKPKGVRVGGVSTVVTKEEKIPEIDEEARKLLKALGRESDVKFQKEALAQPEKMSKWVT